MLGITGLDKLDSQGFQHLVQQRQDPAPFVELLRRYGSGTVRSGTAIRPRQNPATILALPPPRFLACTFSHSLQEVLQRRDQETCENARDRDPPGDQLVFPAGGRRKSESGPATDDVADAMAGICIQRIPIDLAELSKRGLRVVPPDVAGGQHNAPLRGGEAPLSGWAASSIGPQTLPHSIKPPATPYSRKTIRSVRIVSAQVPKTHPSAPSKWERRNPPLAWQPLVSYSFLTNPF